MVRKVQNVSNNLRELKQGSSAELSLLPSEEEHLCRMQRELPPAAEMAFTHEGACEERGEWLGHDETAALQRRTSDLYTSTGLLKVMRGVFCVVGFQRLLFKHMGESDAPTYKLMSRVRILLLVPCYFNETDSGSVKISIFLLLFILFIHFLFISFPKPLHPPNMLAYSLPHPLARNVTLRPSAHSYLPSPCFSARCLQSNLLGFEPR
jgi:hypothetical protein